jgi:autotransporter translocation and assembly factor TamB
MSSQISATSLGTTKLTEQIEKRLKNILGIDFLQVAPMLNGTTIEGESRVSVGKSIAKDFLIVYSTNISSTKQEILYLQYQISPAISLIGMKNEEGRFSIDIRFRKRR